VSEEMPVEGFSAVMEARARFLALSITQSKLFVAMRVYRRAMMLEKRKRFLRRRGKRVS
jgi:hypothetical protein